MANPTTNYNFVLPAPTDLVTDLPADFDIALQGVDTRLKALQPGTTLGDLAYSSATANTNTRLGIGTNGQVLAVVAGEPAWATTADQTPLTTKGDLFTFSTVDARLAVGTNGQVLTADSSEATGLKYTTITQTTETNPNLVINGNFTINQRGYVSAASLTSGTYGFDRFKSNFTSTTLTFTSAPAGQSVTINSGGGLQQIVEQANVPAGSYTLSFTGTATGRIYNSGTVTPPAYAASPISFTADGLANVVVEFTATGATKTLGKIKLELGASATAYNYAGNTIQGELSNCQRYFCRYQSTASFAPFATGMAFAGGIISFIIPFKVRMRTTPSFTYSAASNFAAYTSAGAVVAGTAISLDRTGDDAGMSSLTVASGTTTGQATNVIANSANLPTIDVSAEL